MKKHALSTRLWHWLNLLCVVTLFMSGLTISNAHRLLYWGDWGFSRQHAWLEVPRFPDWMTIPGSYSLAVARDWHILMAWPFALGLLFMWVAMLLNRHFQRDITTTRAEWRPTAIWHVIVEHLKLNFEHAGGKYNFLQKLAYGLVLGVFLPTMVFTGISISPGMEPTFGWLVDLLGGRQSARSLHFIFAFAIFGFFVVHLALVFLAGPIGQIRGMITGGTHHQA
ncbi:cytochrome b/b6 domain-containing protein [Qipengyuania sp. 6B39]|uniref:cytochrome b/b6 domain-containing protein n=1 Tax=Qipengyuania proteolytica TaxID=2867239 RepID=UPI001C8B019A|nr:cytochrome b/b6 domain-containing protein [Qipengyuania proteolytica]MBX7496449.1 cytochrome b/b6 domain-containing protein [Qipengyuania proteolytica]